MQETSANIFSEMKIAVCLVSEKVTIALRRKLNRRLMATVNILT
jgi:hypothetical protein